MEIKRRALYNLLKMNAQRDPKVIAEKWQLMDYRKLSNEQLLKMLKKEGLDLDLNHFSSYAENYESPEELTETLSSEEADIPSQDKLYLIIFELWRRLLPHQASLTIFCDELDHQINLYDLEKLDDHDQLNDVISRLINILDESIDNNTSPEKAFALLSENCANDIEGFLYDYITDQLDLEYQSYALELIDGFYDYVSEKHLFDFLRAKILMKYDQDEANNILENVVKAAIKQQNLSLNLDILYFLSNNGEQHLFISLVCKTIPILQTNDDLQDLLDICIEFTHCLDFDQEEASLQNIKLKRVYNDNKPITKDDPDIEHIKKIITSIST